MKVDLVILCEPISFYNVSGYAVTGCGDGARVANRERPVGEWTIKGFPYAVDWLRKLAFMLKRDVTVGFVKELVFILIQRTLASASFCKMMGRHLKSESSLHEQQ